MTPTLKQDLTIITEQGEEARQLAATIAQGQPNGPKTGQVAIAEAVAMGTVAALTTMSRR